MDDGMVQKRDQKREKTDAEIVAEFWNAHGEALFAQKPVALVRDCSESLLERERWEGTGPRFLKIGRQVRYRKSDVMEWLNAQPCCASTSEYADALPGSHAKARSHDGVRPV